MGNNNQKIKICLTCFEFKNKNHTSRHFKYARSKFFGRTQEHKNKLLNNNMCKINTKKFNFMIAILYRQQKPTCFYFFSAKVYFKFLGALVPYLGSEGLLLPLWPLKEYFFLIHI
jgi:hypothetical protein